VYSHWKTSLQGISDISASIISVYLYTFNAFIKGKDYTQDLKEILGPKTIRYIVEIDRYLGFADISYGPKWQFYRPQWMLTKRCYIPHAFRQLAQGSTMNQVKTIILHQR